MKIGKYEYDLTDFTNRQVKKGFEEYKNGVYNLYDVYKRPSVEKRFRYQECLQKSFDFTDVYQRGIISHNMYVFSYGFIATIHGKRYFVYITRTRNYIVELKEGD